MMEISPEKWKEASIHGIKLSQTVIERSDTGMKYGKRADPLPLLRDACIEQTNDRTRTYTRATRAVVAKLQKSYVAVNEEMKSLNRSKESVEKAIEHKRKDIALNQDSKSIRAYRPPREKVNINTTVALLSETKLPSTLTKHVYISTGRGLCRQATQLRSISSPFSQEIS